MEKLRIDLYALLSLFVLIFSTIQFTPYLALLCILFLFHRRWYTQILLMLAIQLSPDLINSFGVLNFIFFLYFGHFFKDSPYQKKWINLSISILYISPIILRIDDNAWLSGNAALMINQFFHFQGILNLEFIAFNSLTSKMMTYFSVVIELLIAIFVWSKYSKFIYILGIIFHLGLLVTTNIYNWQLFMIAFFTLNLFSKYQETK